MKKKQNNKNNIYKLYIKTSTIGLEITFSIALSLFLGYCGDKYFLLSPYLLIISFIVGIATAFKKLYNFSKKYINENK